MFSAVIYSDLSFPAAALSWGEVLRCEPYLRLTAAVGQQIPQGPLLLAAVSAARISLRSWTTPSHH